MTSPHLALRLIAPNDYIVIDDGQRIGRIRLARERSPSIWLWNVIVTIHGPPFGDAKTIDEANEPPQPAGSVSVVNRRRSSQ